MRKLTIMFIMLFILTNLVNASTQNIFNLNLEYDNGEIILESMQIEPSKDGINNIPGGYIVEILDFDKKRLNVTFFDIPLKLIYDKFDEKTEEAEEVKEEETKEEKPEAPAENTKAEKTE